ncbi:MAG: yajC [Bacteroidetes bacterium]|nr:yajC [Bacteroidota bacterium]
MGQFGQFIPLVLIIVVFYFFMIRPQLKKSKDQKKFRENIKVGDKIITIGGIHGKIVDVQEKTFIISVEGGIKLKIERSAISMDASTLINEEQKTM